MIVRTRQEFIDAWKPHGGLPWGDARNQFEAMAWAGHFMFLEQFETNNPERDILNEMLVWCRTNCHGRFGPLGWVGVGFEEERDVFLCWTFFG